MIRSYNDHAANERTFLAWVRTGLSAIALGIVVDKESLVSLVISDASSPPLAGYVREYLADYGGLALVGTGVAVTLGAGIHFVRTALRIDDDRTHSVAVVRVASALLRRRRPKCGTVESASSSANAGPYLKHTGLLGCLADRASREQLDIRSTTSIGLCRALANYAKERTEQSLQFSERADST